MDVFLKRFMERRAGPGAALLVGIAPETAIRSGKIHYFAGGK
jgi:hypothetical protein